MGEIQTTVDGRPYWETFGYEDADAVVKANLRNGCRAVIAMGYYLKHIRENRLYRDGGYKSFGEYVRVECGLSETVASRSISRMEKFSEGGNSPNLAKKWEAFSASKLQEILYLTDEQAEGVTPDMTVKEIREIRRPETLPEPEEIIVTAVELPAEPDKITVGHVELPEEPVLAPVTMEGTVNDMLPDIPEDWGKETGDSLPQVKETYLRRLAELLVDKTGLVMMRRPYLEAVSAEYIEERIKLFAKREGHDGHIDLGDVDVLVADGNLDFYRPTEEEDLGVSTYARFATQVRKVFDVWLDKRAKGEKEKSLATSQETEESEQEPPKEVEAECNAGGTPLEVLRFQDGRTKKTLKRAGIDTVEELQRMGMEDFMRIRGMSRKQLADIEAALKRWEDGSERRETGSEVEKSKTEKLKTEQKPQEPDQTVPVYNKRILMKMIAEVEDFLSHMDEDWRREAPEYFTRQAMSLEAYHLLMEKYEGKEGEEE